MFLFALTRDGIAENFASKKVEELKIHSLKATIVTDRFLSDVIPAKNGFTILESPLISKPNVRETIFSQVTYDSKTDSINVFKSTLSGRPIYYHTNAKDEFFCSTHISLLRSAGVSIEENLSVLPEFFVFRLIMPPNTLYKNIYQLFCDGALQLKINNGKCTIKSITRYKPPSQDKKITSITQSAKNVYDYLSESLKKLESRKVETTVLLSGGIDSSILSTICKENLLTKKSYSTGYPFEDSAYNLEKTYSLSAAKALEMDHTFYEPSNQEYLTGFLEAIELAEEPLHHLQSVLFHLLFKKGIPKEQRIIVHGQGAGTTFGSNDFLYIQNRIFFKILSKKPPFHALNKASRFSPSAKKLVEILNKSYLKDSYSDPRNPLWSWMDFGSKNWVCRYFNTTENDIIKERYEIIKNIQSLSLNDIWALYSLFSDEQITLSIWSKIGEGNQKIVYFPYYDKAVLDYVLSIPWELKLHKPIDNLRKKLAHQAQIPNFIIDRKKSSLGIRSNDWAEKNGVFESILPLASKVFDIKEIQKMQSPEPKKAMTYWNMLNYSLWKRLHINNEPLEVLQEELEKTN